MKRLMMSLAAAALAALAAFGAAEFLLRWKAEGGFRAAWRSVAEQKPPHGRLRSSFRFVADGELGFRLDPQEPGVNSLGLRSPEIAPRPAHGRWRILVIGDSVAAPADGFVKLLAQKLAGRAEVINAAVPGYTVHQERVFLERLLPRLQPEAVLLQYCINDHHRFLHLWDEERGMLLTREARRALFPAEGGALGWLPQQSYLALELRLARLRWRWRSGKFPWENRSIFSPAWTEAGWRLYEQEFAAMAGAAERASARMLVAIFPVAFQFDSGLIEKHRDLVLRPQRELEVLAREQGVPALDLYPAFAEAGGAGLFVDELHLNAQGHEAAAKAIRQFLRTEGLP